jgi:hypothetical protein
MVTKMKNYLVRSLHKIKSPEWFKDRSDEGDIYSKYMEMHEITLKSLKHFVQGDWELVFYNEETDNIRDTFRKNFFEIYNLWRSEPCNILYCGIDVQAIAPVDFFGQFKEFRMFNYTDPREFQDCPVFFNADVRYYPAEMSQEIWDFGLEMANNWDMEEWNTEQVILNKMMWKQGLTLEQGHMPYMAYQAPWLPGPQENKDYTDKWNGCRLEESRVIHWHGSRNADAKLQIIKHINDQLQIQ